MAGSRRTFSKIGLGVSLVPWVVLGALLLIRPGRGNPVGALLGLLSLVSIPAGFGLSLVGILRDRPRTYAILGLILSASAGLFLFGLPILAALR
jgi:hypothetical protein